jgi:hypothetical protein
MTNEASIVRKRRGAAEVEQLVSEFEGSGLNRSEFCRRQGLALITLNRYLKRVRGAGAALAGNSLLAVELGDGRRSAGRSSACGVAVVLAGGRRIEVSASFDAAVLHRLIRTLERM